MMLVFSKDLIRPRGETVSDIDSVWYAGYPTRTAVHPGVKMFWAGYR